jgi:hypothetical protein
VILTATLYPLLVHSERICSIKQCDRCLAPSLQSAPGLGFHLGLSTGYVATPVFNTLAYENSTVAVSDNDSHVKDIINIPGSPEYITLMKEFTTNPNQLDRPPLATIAQRLSFVWKALKRRINLLLGRPGSPNAATLSSMLKLLRSETESRLSISVTTVGIAFPNAALESPEEVNDTLSYAGLSKLDQRPMADSRQRGGA